MRGGGNGAFVFGSNVAMREIEVLARGNALKQRALGGEFNRVPTNMGHFAQHALGIPGRHANHGARNHAQPDGQAGIFRSSVDPWTSCTFHTCLKQQVLT